MKRSILLLLCVAMLSTVISSAQERKVGFGLKAGVTATSLTIPKGELSQSAYRAGFTGGLFTDYRFHKRWALSADLLYARAGANIDKVHYPLNTHHTTELDIKLDYLQIPVLINFYLTRSLAVKTGIQPSFLLDKRVSYSENGAVGPMSTASTDWVIPVGISYELNCGVIFDARYNAGVKYSVNPCDFPSTTVAFAFTVGYRLK